METKAVAVAHWEDVVFEKRNKLYGAYQLRRHYSERLITGLGINVAILVAFLWWSKMTFGDVIPPIIPPIPVGTGVEVSPPPTLDRPKLRQAQTQRVTQSTVLPPRVVSEPVIDEPVVDVEPVDVATSDIGDGGSTGIVDGNTGTAIVEPVAVKPPATVVIAEVMPKFGEDTGELMRYITRNIKYPRSAQRIGIEGTVFVEFVVMWDGSVQNVQVVKGIHPDCDKEAMRVIASMPKWMAGSQNGSPVNVRMVLPIKFKITN